MPKAMLDRVQISDLFVEQVEGFTEFALRHFSASEKYSSDFYFSIGDHKAIESFVMDMNDFCAEWTLMDFTLWSITIEKLMGGLGAKFGGVATPLQEVGGNTDTGYLSIVCVERISVVALQVPYVYNRKGKPKLAPVSEVGEIDSFSGKLIQPIRRNVTQQG